MMWVPDREELAWAAGFFDGEGATVREHDRLRLDGTRRVSPRLDISQADRKILQRFQSAVGGLGKLYGPYSHNPRSKKPIWFWRTGKFEHVQAALAMLWFKLGKTKRAQAARILKEASK